MSSGTTPAIKHEGKVVPARRLVWQQAYGDVPDGAKVASACENVRCVNPLHMKLARPKLNEADVRTIRRSRLPSNVLATLYRIDRGNVNRIQRGELWGHVV